MGQGVSTRLGEGGWLRLYDGMLKTAGAGS